MHIVFMHIDWNKTIYKLAGDDPTIYTKYKESVDPNTGLGYHYFRCAIETCPARYKWDSKNNSQPTPVKDCTHRTHCQEEWSNLMAAIRLEDMAREAAINTGDAPVKIRQRLMNLPQVKVHKYDCKINKMV